MGSRPANLTSTLLRDGMGFTAFAVSVFAAAVCTTVLSMAAWHPSSGDVLAGVMLVAAFAVARRTAIEVDVRQSTWRITVTEVPLVVGLLLAPTPVVAFSFVLVVLVARLLRRDTWAKLLLNVASSALVVELTGFTFGLLRRGHEPPG